MLRKNLLATGIVLLMLGGCVGGVMLMREKANSHYPMRVMEYYKQADQIRPGMTVEEVRAMLRGVTRETAYTYPSKSGPGHPAVGFAMEPDRRGGFGITTHFIVIHLGPNHRVVSVSTNDG
jgi:hypothetical protein